ncbi:MULTISPECIES: hypothetical protein [unclassified Nocardia]|uniref:hypothetical protein n=1 Tax=unclassified Nocardia TaxID=2637762 RepID=UPI001CE451D2|nr:MULTISPECIES: hypothetical protein [unclassified Nocardia]
MDIEETFGEAQLKLRRRVIGLEIWAGRATDLLHTVSRNQIAMMEHFGIPHTPTSEVSMATEAEIDAAIEAED